MLQAAQVVVFLAPNEISDPLTIGEKLYAGVGPVSFDRQAGMARYHISEVEVDVNCSPGRIDIIATGVSNRPTLKPEMLLVDREAALDAIVDPSISLMHYFSDRVNRVALVLNQVTPANNFIEAVRFARDILGESVIPKAISEIEYRTNQVVSLPDRPSVKINNGRKLASVSIFATPMVQGNVLFQSNLRPVELFALSDVVDINTVVGTPLREAQFEVILEYFRRAAVYQLDQHRNVLDEQV